MSSARLLSFPSFAAAALIGAAVLATPVRAGTFTATELSYDKALLNQFNLVNLGNYTTTNETEGRIIVGGNATVNAATNVCFQAACSGNSTVGATSSTTNGVVTTGTTYGALTVFGNIAGSGFSTGNNGGDIRVGGNSTVNGTFNLRNKGDFAIAGTAASTTTVDSATRVRTSQSSFGGRIQNSGNSNVAYTSATAAPNKQSLATVFPFGSAATSLTSPLKALSTGIANLPGSPGVSAKQLTVGNNIFFSPGVDYTASNGKKYGVVTTTLANLASETNFLGIDNGTNDATFVIVTGDGANYVLPNLNSYTGADKVIFDFVDATTLRFAGTWNGTILAPLATITQQGGVIDGSVVVASINQTMELHQTNLFTGDLSGLSGITNTAAVPEPASLALLGLGFGAVAFIRRRRK